MFICKELQKFLLIVFIYASGNFYSQTPLVSSQKVDSIELALKKVNSDTARMRILSSFLDKTEVSQTQYYSKQLGILSIRSSQSKDKSISISGKRYYGAYLINCAVYEGVMGKEEKSLDLFNQSISVSESIHDTENIISAILGIADFYRDQGDPASALSKYKIAYTLAGKVRNKRLMVYTLNDFGVIHYREKNLDSALYYFQAAYNIGYTEDYSLTSSLINNIASIYGLQKKYGPATKMLNLRIKLSEKVNDWPGVSMGNRNLATLYFKKNELKKSEDYGLKSLKIAKQINNFLSIRYAAQILKDIYTKNGNYKKALQFTNLYYAMRDSLRNEETQKDMVRHQLKSEFAIKTAADSIKNAEERKVSATRLALQESKLKQETTQRYALYGGITLIAGFLIFVFNRFRITNRQKKIIEQQKVQVDMAYEKLHDKNKEVMDSIHYAQRIQRTLLTPEKYIEKKLKFLNKR